MLRLWAGGWPLELSLAGPGREAEMSRAHYVYIGPCAVWEVPADRAGEFPPLDEAGNDLCSERLACNYDADVPAVLDREGREVHLFCYISQDLRPPGGRQLFFWGQPHAGLGLQDLTDVDRRAEVSWFRKEYAAELRVLAGRFGSRPAVRWGVMDRAR
jgi:hypothetical protein